MQNDKNKNTLESQPAVSVFRLWCEYDYGQDGVVFWNKKDARDWLNRQVFDIEGDNWAETLCANPEMYPADHLDLEGLISFEKLALI